MTTTIPTIYKSMFSDDKLWITVHQEKKYNNKMSLMSSIMIEHADICHQRRKCNPKYSDNTVCKNCYSYIQSSMHPVVREKMRNNSAVLDRPSFKPVKIRTINNCLRYISFGDIQNHIQALNILRHSRVNPALFKAVWTKQYKHMKSAINQVNTLELTIKRLNLIWSCSRLNCTKFIIPKDFSKSFYVYTSEEELNAAYQKCLNEFKHGDHNYTPFKCTLQCNSCKHCYTNSNKTIVMEMLK